MSDEMLLVLMAVMADLNLSVVLLVRAQRVADRSLEEMA